MLAKRQFPKRKHGKGNDENSETNRRLRTILKVKHSSVTAVEKYVTKWPITVKRNDNANKADELSLYAIIAHNLANEILDSRGTKHSDKWCIDSGCTVHLCRSVSEFVEIKYR